MPFSAWEPPEEDAGELRQLARRIADLTVERAREKNRLHAAQASRTTSAAVINDISALTSEPEALRAAAETGLPVILMHMLGEPRTMQQAPRYDDVVLDVYDYLARRIEACQAAGISLERICVDPGVGFGKTTAHNVELVARLSIFHGLGCPLLLGVSRKSFIGKLSRGEAPKERVAGTLAVTLAGLLRGAQIHRVHDVEEALQAMALWQAVEAAGAGMAETAKPISEKLP